MNRGALEGSGGTRTSKRSRWLTLLASVLTSLAVGIAVVVGLGGAVGQVELAVIAVLVVAGIAGSVRKFVTSKQVHVTTGECARRS